ncbi:hypothetical protein [Lysobacter sp. CA199]|uniref:hypothetical protein n=1 Tax=Lysobacter sp. CA199 TaxID=3455608 RepID=UPI003F8D1849
MTQDSRPADASADFPWPLTFDEFTFGAMVYNTLGCKLLFENFQFVPERELLGPSGPPLSPNWKDRWTADFIVGVERMPPSPVEVEWTSLDGAKHHDEIDLIKDIFSGQLVLHNVPKEDINEDWARYEGGKTSAPDILMEVNNRTINVFMSAHVLTKSFPIPGREDVKSRWDLVLAWTKTY